MADNKASYAVLSCFSNWLLINKNISKKCNPVWPSWFDLFFQPIDYGGYFYQRVSFQNDFVFKIS